MCGIVGILGSDDPSTRETVAAMVSAIAHRGPNVRQVKACRNGVLGHARLSIIDLDERAGQPMESTDGRHIIVFNGEIYNYKEIRAELWGVYPFKTTSDTEVLLAAFCHWGEDCLGRLNGMFAFCIYDQIERRAFFARDRFGQKPLFFTERDGAFLFASEAKGLLAAGVKAQPNKKSWARYLAKASFDDNADTFFDGIFQMRPGECGTHVSGKGLSRRRYYNVAEHVRPQNISVEDAAERTRAMMVDAVRLHMRSDVPVGISLSGGLDSSAILSCLALGDGIPEDLSCFSMEYGSDLSERPWIDAAAGPYGLKSTYGTFSREKFQASLSRTMWHQEAPIGGLPNCALEEVSRAARSAGVRVLQDGTGLDEAFAGYRNHHNLYLGMLLEEDSPQVDDAVREYAANWGVDIESAVTAANAERSSSGSAIDGSTPVRHDLLTDECLFLGMRDCIEEETSLGPLRHALADYLQVRKIPRNMRMKDRATMAFGIELRLPFLDHRLVELALSFPTEYYFLHGRSKSILREAMSGAMDDSVRLAAKRSIQAPQELWLRSAPMKPYIEDLLQSDSFAERGLVDPGKAQTAYADFCEKGATNSLFVWQWVNMEEWFRTFVDCDSIASPYPACAEVSGLAH